MKLEDIGFYSLWDERALNSSYTSRLERCEVLLTNRCNFNCPYCRHVGPEEDMSFESARGVVSYWALNDVRNIRFSGGEPTLMPYLSDLVKFSRNFPWIEHIAISTNGSAGLDVYKKLLDSGVNDFSISLDSCCAQTAGEMMGVKGEIINIVMNTIKFLSSKTYVTLGVVITPINIKDIEDVIKFAQDAGVSDVRLISSAQWNGDIKVNISNKALDKFPILRYRNKENIIGGKPIRGLGKGHCPTCYLALDDMAVMNNKHYPCIIYLREGGRPIGELNADTRKDRLNWVVNHNGFKDHICKNNCLDFCSMFNVVADRRKNESKSVD